MQQSSAALCLLVAPVLCAGRSPLWLVVLTRRVWGWVWGWVWHEAMVLVCLPLHILTLVRVRVGGGVWWGGGEVGKKWVHGNPQGQAPLAGGGGGAYQGCIGRGGQGAQPMPRRCVADGIPPASMALATGSNRPQPPWQPPLNACLTASGAASEVHSLLVHPRGWGGHTVTDVTHREDLADAARPQNDCVGGTQLWHRTGLGPGGKGEGQEEGVVGWGS